MIYLSVQPEKGLRRGAKIMYGNEEIAYTTEKKMQFYQFENTNQELYLQIGSNKTNKITIPSSDKFYALRWQTNNSKIYLSIAFMILLYICLFVSDVNMILTIFIIFVTNLTFRLASGYLIIDSRQIYLETLDKNELITLTDTDKAATYFLKYFKRKKRQYFKMPFKIYLLCGVIIYIGTVLTFAILYSGFLRLLFI